MIHNKTIRSATPEDASRIAEIHIAAWRAAYTHFIPQDVLDHLDHAEWEEKTRNRISEGCNFLVSEVDGTTAAYALWLPFPRSIDWPHKNLISSLYCHPDFFGQGHGTALIRACARLAKEKGHTGMMIEVFKDNVRTLALYERLGGRKISEGTFTFEGKAYPDILLAFDDLDILVDG